MTDTLRFTVRASTYPELLTSAHRERDRLLDEDPLRPASVPSRYTTTLQIDAQDVSARNTAGDLQIPMYVADVTLTVSPAGPPT